MLEDRQVKRGQTGRLTMYRLRGMGTERLKIDSVRGRGDGILEVYRGTGWWTLKMDRRP